MALEANKVSFSFSKVARPSRVQSLKSWKPEEQIQYVDCLDGKSIKVKGSDSLGNNNVPSKELVIPLSTSSPLTKGSKLREIISQSDHSSSEKPTTPGDLDSIAVQELINDAKKSKHDRDTPSSFTLELPSKEGESHVHKQSTLEDYESVPITAYGLAMLRGMGWKPNKGIGKMEKVVAPVEPKVRPRGMGLGVVVERSAKPPATKTNPLTNEEEELKVVKGAYIRVTGGRKKGMYGQIEGFDNLGALILKMALGGSAVSMNENLVEPVTKDEFKKNSRVINASKYKEYKDKELNGVVVADTADSHSSFSNRPEHSHMKSGHSRTNSHSKSDHSHSSSYAKSDHSHSSSHAKSDQSHSSSHAKSDHSPSSSHAKSVHSHSSSHAMSDQSSYYANSDHLQSSYHAKSDHSHSSYYADSGHVQSSYHSKSDDSHSSYNAKTDHSQKSDHAHSSSHAKSDHAHSSSHAKSDHAHSSSHTKSEHPRVSNSGRRNVKDNVIKRYRSRSRTPPRKNK